jgi:hypothetical protein
MIRDFGLLPSMGLNISVLLAAGVTICDLCGDAAALLVQRR